MFLRTLRTMSTAQNLASLSKQDLLKFLKSFDTVLTDCDGVLWLYSNVIPGSPKGLEMLREMGKKIFYITNNSTKSREEFVTKCGNMGYTATRDSILSTSYLTACYLHDLNFKKSVYVVGSPGITQELDEVGIVNHNVTGPDPLPDNLEQYVTKVLKFDPDIGAVVVGFDPHISFPKILKAASYLSNPDCLFIATNRDERFPMKHELLPNLVIPGTGSIVKAIETCANRSAFTIGKPSPYICDAIEKRYKNDPKRTLMIGDRCNTDIMLGKHGGYQTLLVLTGVTSLKELNEWENSGQAEHQDLIPDYYTNTLGDLVTLLQ